MDTIIFNQYQAITTFTKLISQRRVKYGGYNSISIIIKIALRSRRPPR
jgi:hypothetical protein